MLGHLRLDTNIILAPMMDITTPSYILLRKYYGTVGLYTIPMVFINQINAAPKNIRPAAEFAEKNRPSSIQICGSGRSSEDIKTAVEILNTYEFDFLDINCGCPAKHTCKSGGGASLMQPHRFNDLQRLINSAVSTSNKPVSVKIRIGWNSTDGLREIVKMIENENASFLTVHGRLAEQRYSGIVDLESIKKVKEYANIPVIGNGDVYSYESYTVMKKFTGVDAVMIGRASMGNPKVFGDIEQKLKLNMDDKREYLGENTTEEGKAHSIFLPEYRAKVQKINTVTDIRGYISKISEIIGKLDKYWNNNRLKLKEIRRNAIWMLRGSYNAAKVREKIGRIKLIKKLVEYINGDKFKMDLEIH
ncbi:MAG: tRNA dihydrouridine synthase [Promethearchaeota archaeon]